MNNVIGKILRISDLSILFFPMHITSVHEYKNIHCGEMMLVLNVINSHKSRVFTILCRHGIGKVVETTEYYPSKKITYEVVA